MIQEIRHNCLPSGHYSRCYDYELRSSLARRCLLVQSASTVADYRCHGVTNLRVSGVDGDR